MALHRTCGAMEVDDQAETPRLRRAPSEGVHPMLHLRALHLRAVLGISALLCGLAAVPANAATTRVENFKFFCDGTNKTILTFRPGQNDIATNPPLPVNANIFFVGAELILLEDHGGLQYVLVSGGNGNTTTGDRTKQLLSIGLNQIVQNNFGFSVGVDRAANILNGQTLIPVTTNASGQVQIQIDGACSPAFANAAVQGTLTVWLSGPGIP